jgi:hypothetical protein
MKWDGGSTGLTASTGRTSLGLGTAATRNAEDTLTNGSNLPDGAAIIAYGNANWGGSGTGYWTQTGSDIYYNLGSVGIGTASPAQKLQVAGTAQMTGFKLTTSPVSGYVLTSDSSGVGTWQAPSGGGMVYPGAGIAVSTGSAWATSVANNSTNWNTAYTDRMKWNGGSSGLNASTGRYSLGLGTAATRNAEDTLTNGSNLPDGAAVITYGNAHWGGGGGGLTYVFQPSGYTEAALQTAIDSAEAVKGTVWIPAGTYNITSGLTVTAPIQILGAGGATIDGVNNSGTVLNCSATKCINITCDYQVTIRDVLIKTSGTYGVYVDDDGSSSWGNGHSRFDNVNIYGGSYGIYFEAAYYWTVSNCYMVNQTTASILVDNTTNGDAGDSVIHGCTMWPAVAATASVIQYASGGLKISNTKFAGLGALDTSNPDYGYLLDLQNRSGTGTGILEISGCSFEHQDVASICFTNSSPDIFIFASIVGNQIREGIVINAPSGGNDHIKWITISDNTILGQTSISSGVAIGGGSGINIVGNVIDANGQDYGIICGGGTVWQGNNAIMNYATSKTVGTFQSY